MNRVFFSVCLMLSVILLPWWVALAMSLIGIYVYEQYYEAVASMILVHILYGFPSTRFISSDLYFPILVIVLFYVLSMIKKFIFIKNI